MRSTSALSSSARGDRGDRDPLVNGPVPRIETAHAVQDDAVEPLARARRGHIDARARAATKVPKMRGVPVAEDRVRPASQHRRHPPTTQLQHRVADGVHARMDAMKAPGPKPILDRLPPQPQFQQLPVGHDTVLPNGERDDPPVTWAV
jgi:hypothetical protein